MKKVIFILLFLLYNINVTSAETNILTLQDCIDLAMKNNFQIKKEQINLQTAVLNLDITKSAYYPKLTLGAAVPAYTEHYVDKSGLNPDHYYYHKLDNSLTASVKTEIPTGAKLDMGLAGVYNIIDSENKVYRPDSQDVDYYFSAGIEQPLFKRNKTRIDISKSKAALKNQKMNYNQQVKNIKYNITELYLSLLKSLENYKITKNSFNKSKLNYELSLKKYETGLIPEVEVLILEGSYNQNQVYLLGSENRITRSRETLLFNIGLPLDYPFRIVKDVSYKAIQIDPKETLENTILKDYYLNNQYNNIFNKEEEYKEIKDDSNLDANVKLSYNYNINQEPSPYYYDYYWGASLNLAYPLFDFGLNKKRLKIKQKEIEKTRIDIKNQKISLERNLNNLLSGIEENYKTISILSNDVYVSQKRYDISQKQFQDGIITTQELLDSESALDNSEKQYLNAIMDYKIKLSKLETEYEVVYRK